MNINEHSFSFPHSLCFYLLDLFCHNTPISNNRVRSTFFLVNSSPGQKGLIWRHFRSSTFVEAVLISYALSRSNVLEVEYRLTNCRLECSEVDVTVHNLEFV